jgi:hypothetical protein
MGKPVLEPMSEPEWREVVDPHSDNFRWRYRALVLELSAPGYFDWLAARPHTSSTTHYMVAGDYWLHYSPEREALWKDLFLNP